MQENNQNPDVNSPVNPGAESDIEQIHNNDPYRSNEEMPVPPDTEPNAPVEEPPETSKPAIEEDNTEPKQLV